MEPFCTKSQLYWLRYYSTLFDCNDMPNPILNLNWTILCQMRLTKLEFEKSKVVTKLVQIRSSFEQLHMQWLKANINTNKTKNSLWMPNEFGSLLTKIHRHTDTLKCKKMKKKVSLLLIFKRNFVGSLLILSAI